MPTLEKRQDPANNLNPSLIQTQLASNPGQPSNIWSPNVPTIAIALAIIFSSILCGLVFLSISRLKFKKVGACRNSMTQEKIITNIKGTNSAQGPVTDLIQNKGPFHKSDQYKCDNGKRTKTSETKVPVTDSSPTKATKYTRHDDYIDTTASESGERIKLAETDISRAIGFVLENCEYSESDLSLALDNRDEDFLQNIKLNGFLGKQDPDGTHLTQITTETESDWVPVEGVTRKSSMTSIPHGDSEGECSILQEEFTAEDMTFEVGRAQTQSMEIKKGVLVNLSPHRKFLAPIQEEAEMELTLESLSPEPKSQSLHIPSVLVTCPSTMTLPIIGPSLSSISVDLNDFPLPPIDHL